MLFPLAQDVEGSRCFTSPSLYTLLRGWIHAVVPGLTVSDISAWISLRQGLRGTNTPVEVSEK